MRAKFVDSNEVEYLAGPVRGISRARAVFSVVEALRAASFAGIMMRRVATADDRAVT